MGRKRKGGAARTKDGKRLARGRVAWDYGNDRMVELEHRFAPFQDGKAGQWIKTPIGRAWAVGLLDGFDVDPAAIRDAGLFYAERYWGYWPAAATVGSYDGEDRRGRSWGDDRDRTGKVFQALDAAINSSGRASVAAVHELVIDHHWFPLDDPAWLGRLLNERLLRAKRPVAGELPRPGDMERLRLAVDGLLTVVAGGERRYAA